jgi:hypothetical protein
VPVTISEIERKYVKEYLFLPNSDSMAAAALTSFGSPLANRMLLYDFSISSSSFILSLATK